MYPLRDGGYLVCKSGYPQYAGDLEQLEALVVRPGGKPYA
jgi:hypothetical protein